MRSMILLQRFFSRQQVIEKYGIRPDFEEEFFEECPVAFKSCGESMYREADVDEYARHFRTPPYIHPSRRRGGTKPLLNDIAAYGWELKQAGKSWKEVASEINKKCSHLPGHNKRNAESMRKLVERSHSRQMRTDGQDPVVSDGCCNVE